MLVIAIGAVASAGFATLVEAQTVSASWPHYTVTVLDTLGGIYSSGYGGVTDNGWVSGDSSLLGDTNEHASVWRDGVITDLGTFGGANSWPQKNTHGLLVGQAESLNSDPLNENWALGSCPTGPCPGPAYLGYAFRWQNGLMTRLPGLGGNYSEATGDNNLGQAVGLAETATVAPTGVCSPPQVLEINAVVWGPSGKVQQQLYPLEGDYLSAAFGINDNGDVVGCSGTCGIPNTPALCLHAVLWRNGRVINLPSLGGAINNYPVVINNAGQIAGISDPSGDATTYAVLWQNGTITSLGALPGDALSVTQDMNAKGQVVGLSCDVNFNCRAFLWEKGVGMIDLNSLIPPNSPLYLTVAEGINDRGEISGNAVLKNNPNPNATTAFLAIPAPAAQIAGASVQKMMLPANVRASLQRRLRLGHFGIGTTAQQ
jgi:probable HAF family extracellular repeat protein